MIVDLSNEIELMPATAVEEILQNVRMIVSVWRGEVPLDRTFGIDPTLIDAPIKTVRARLVADLAESIDRCEPRAKLKAVEFKGTDGRLEPVVIIEIKE